MRLLNWEKGARLSTPVLDLEEIHPIGRGVTQDCDEALEDMQILM